MGGLIDGEANRALIRQAHSYLDWNQCDSTPTVDQIDAALAELENQKQPLKQQEVGLDGQVSRLIEDALRPIGAAVDPRISGEQAKAWRKALLLKLSNLPGLIVLKATRTALHESFTFLGDVEPKVRQIALNLLDQQRAVILRLKRWRDELERANRPALPADPVTITQAEVDATNRQMRRIGSRKRWRLEDGEAVMFELEEPEEPEPEDGTIS